MSEDQEGKLCEECGKNKATIHLTDFVDGTPVKTNLCEECYSKKAGVPPLSSSQLLQTLLGAMAPELQKMARQTCPFCGISYLEFRQNYRLGCQKDYEVFQEPLDELLKQIHGADRHIGKIPAGAAQEGALAIRMEVTQRELEEAVKKEDFEKAARLRDEIKKLERKGAGTTEE